MPAINLTRRAVQAIPHPETGQVLYRDTQLRGFGLRVGAKSKVYFAEGQVDRRTRRVTIGRADVLHPEEARRRALAILSEMSAGRNPNQKREQLTFEQATEAFFKARDGLAPMTIDHYRRALRVYLADWRKRPLAEITRQMVLARHQRLARDHGQTTANNAMRQFRSIYNFTAAAHDDFPPNPVGILSQARAWYPERRRRRVIEPHDFPAWWAAVMEEPDYSRDLQLIALFTGMRRAEVTRLRWENVNFISRTLHLPKTKNGDPLDLPLSDFLIDLLRARRTLSPWVFPSKGRRGHIVETKKFTARVAERSGVPFTLHDLRRTFITIAESLDIPHYALKRLLNHRTGGDVTGGYIVIHTERLRGRVEAVARQILEMAESDEQRRRA